MIVPPNDLVIGAIVSTVLSARVRAALVLFSGALTALALPPLDVVPAVFGWSVLAWAIRVAPGWRGAALAGWLWALGYHVAGLHWIANAMVVNADQHAWLIPFAVLGLPAILALFTAVAAAVARRLADRGLALWAGFAGCVGLTEWLRGHVFTGFPWNLPGAALDAVLALLQPASIVGAYGLGLATVLVATAPALFFDPAVPRRRVGWLTAGLIMMVSVTWLWGEARIATIADRPAVEGVRLRIVQGNVPQRDKWNPALKPEHLSRYLRLSRADMAATVTSAGTPTVVAPTVVIWPETAVAHLFGARADIARAVAAAIPPNGTLLFGAPRVDRRDATPVLHNSMVALEGRGVPRWIYDKFHLVPFGEYVPLRSILPLEPIVQGIRDFAPGPGPRTLELLGAPSVSLLVCYEAIFPGAVTAPEQRPEWLLNATNDAWFGRFSGPHQHLAIARLRSVEEGLPMARAANTGISAMIDPVGRVLARLEIGVTGSLDVNLPRPIVNTVYGQFGDLGFFLAIILILGIAVLARSFEVEKKQ